MTSVTIDWEPIICECEKCVCQILVQYRAQGTATWTTPSSPANPTQEGNYTIFVDEGIYYTVRITFIGPLCRQKYTEIPIYVPADQCCPTGYTYSAQNDYCYKVDDVPAIAPVSPATLVAKTHQAYSTCGSYIYSLGWNVNGTGASTQIPLTNNFWKNGGTCVDSTTTNGPLNRTGVWVNPALDGQTIGFGVCIDVTQEKDYYIGIAADNYAEIRVDGVLRLSQDAVNLGTQYGVGVAATFKVWHIYPIHLEVGPHIISLTGVNIVSAAALGCEIYDATAAELIAATSYADLGAKLLFSSKDEIGQPAQIGTGGAGYTCPTVPEGEVEYTLASCEEPVVCRRVINTPKISC